MILFDRKSCTRKLRAKGPAYTSLGHRPRSYEPENKRQRRAPWTVNKIGPWVRPSSLFKETFRRLGIKGVSLYGYRYAWA